MCDSHARAADARRREIACRQLHDVRQLHGDDVVAKALASPIVQEGDGGAGSGSSAPAEDGAPAGARAAVKQVYQHLMTGVSYMLPFVVAGGLMIAISFAVLVGLRDRWFGRSREATVVAP